MIVNDKDENDIPYMGPGDRCYLSAVLYFTDWKYIIIIIIYVKVRHKLQMTAMTDDVQHFGVSNEASGP